MTRLGVERMPRTACPPSFESPAGVSSSLPPLIQGAERRTESRARRTGVRWGLRVLVIGGLAGAAWLLTGAAAQAADRTDEPIGSLLGSVLYGDTTTPVTGLLEAAAQPLETLIPAHSKHQYTQNVVHDILDVPPTSPAPHVRKGSRRSGASTLMTSAPKSASRRPAKGPAMREPSSTTRRPSSGRGRSSAADAGSVDTAATVHNPGAVVS